MNFGSSTSQTQKNGFEILFILGVNFLRIGIALANNKRTKVGLQELSLTENLKLAMNILDLDNLLKFGNI